MIYVRSCRRPRPGQRHDGVDQWTALTSFLFSRIVFSDHPSFPEGILKRALELEGFSVGTIERPFWQKTESFMVLGRPRLFFGIIAGPVDSVVLNYTSSRKRRKEDLYQLAGDGFFPDCPPSIQYKVRPDRTTIVFANRIREAFRDVPIVVGGIESSLRLFGHYDFQQDGLRRSILLDARADLAVTGMGEKQIVAIARSLNEGAIAANALPPRHRQGPRHFPGRGRLRAPSFF